MEDARDRNVGHRALDDVAKQPGEQTEISMTLHNSDEGMETPGVYFYDGDPKNGGKIIAIERLAFIDKDKDHAVRVLVARLCAPRAEAAFDAKSCITVCCLP